MTKSKREYTCRECLTVIEEKLFLHTSEKFGYPLCRPCQIWYEEKICVSRVTMESISLYFALKLRGVPAILEEQTGFRTIDILVPHARLNIELEAAGNNFKPDRAIQELETALDGFKNGFLTLRIPES